MVVITIVRWIKIAKLMSMTTITVDIMVAITMMLDGAYTPTNITGGGHTLGIIKPNKIHCL